MVQTHKQIFSIKITDFSGSILITAFRKYADMIYNVYEDGKEFYVTRRYGENDITNSIYSNGFKIVLTPI